MATALLLSFAVLLLIGVLISERAHRTVLSTAVLFLVGGFLLGPGAFGFITVTSGDPIVSGLAELALFSVLFTDGMRVGFRDLRTAWRLPGRALLLGLPLTLALTAVFAHYLVGLPWLESFLLGAILAPTDPVFAAAIVGREEVPARLRHLLNVESGVNDGLALPIVLILLAAAGGSNAHGEELLLEIVLGIAVGVIVPVIVLGLERLPFLQAIRSMQPLLAVSIGLLVLAICQATANLFLGAFAAGITVATLGKGLRHDFEQFGELVTGCSNWPPLWSSAPSSPRPSCSATYPSPGGSSPCSPSSSPGPLHCWCPSSAPNSVSANKSPRCGSGRRASPRSSTA